MKIRVMDEEKIELSTICRQLKLESSDGKKYETDCADVEGMFCVIQSIPSPKAEPFKRWLAKVGYERIQEIENPELMWEGMKRIYVSLFLSSRGAKRRGIPSIILGVIMFFSENNIV